MKPNWLTIRNEAESAEILIQGAIGASPWDESGVSEKEFTNALKSIPEGRPITVGINSQGGSIQDGLGIYNALRRRGDAVTVRIDGYAVSIASVIALAGSKRISPKSSVWMIHEPAMLAFGNAEDMDRARLALEAHAEVITDIYAERTSLTKDDARAKMKAETWFRGEEAVEMGFATEANEASVALNSLDATKFKTIPDFIKAQLTGPQQGTALASEPIQQPVACAPEISADTVASGRSLPAEGSTNTKGTKDENQKQ
jgi:ATP-dependent protease ClpP protease subunit